MLITPCSEVRVDMTACLMRLAAEWAEAAGSSIAWLDDADISARMLTEPDPAKRALWRCVLQLLERLSAASGREVRELVADFAAQPVQQAAEGP